MNFSFISEHIVFTKKSVQELIDKISKKNSSKIWWEIILDAVELKHLNNSGFSEYESYGNYIISTNPKSIITRNLPKYRSGMQLLGEKPSTFLLRLLSFKYYYISFETFQRTKHFFPIRQIKVLYLILLVKYKKLK